MGKITLKSLAEILEQMQGKIAGLSERVAQIEAIAAREPGPQPEPVAPSLPQAPAPELPRPEISDEELVAISAALGAYLGVRVHIRHVRLLGSRAWSQQGRVSIQASHNVHI
jgi:methylmalonyl-CoA carboxyltransferase large subunit